MMIPTSWFNRKKKLWDVGEHLESQPARAAWKNLQGWLCFWVGNCTFRVVTHLCLVPGFMLDMIYSELLIMPFIQIELCYSTHLIGVEILPNVWCLLASSLFEVNQKTTMKTFTTSHLKKNRWSAKIITSSVRTIINIISQNSADWPHLQLCARQAALLEELGWIPAKARLPKRPKPVTHWLVLFFN